MLLLSCVSAIVPIKKDNIIVCLKFHTDKNSSHRASKGMRIMNQENIYILIIMFISLTVKSLKFKTLILIVIWSE